MTIKFDIDKIANYLYKYKGSLSTLYTWNEKIDKLADLDTLSEKQISEINLLSPYIKDAYFELKTLIKTINKSLWKGDLEKGQNLYYTEMLLFSIADREVFMDITTRYKIRLK